MPDEREPTCERWRQLMRTFMISSDMGHSWPGACKSVCLTAYDCLADSETLVQVVSFRLKAVLAETGNGKLSRVTVVWLRCTTGTRVPQSSYTVSSPMLAKSM